MHIFIYMYIYKDIWSHSFNTTVSMKQELDLKHPQTK